MEAWIKAWGKKPAPDNLRFGKLPPPVPGMPFSPKPKVKAYSPDEARDKTGKWTEGDLAAVPHNVVMYHGTVSDVLKSIKKQGLKPQGGKGGDAWLHENDPSGYTRVVNSRLPSVFMSPDFKVASRFAALAQTMNPGSTPVILKVAISDKEAANLIEDEQYVGNAVRYPGTIPPDHITSYALSPKSTTDDDNEMAPIVNKFMRQFGGDIQPWSPPPDPKTLKWKPMSSIQAAAGGVYYAIVLCSNLNMLNYSPDEQRDNHGRWSKGGGSVFVSPNVEENLNLDDALKALTNDRQRRFEAKEKDIVASVLKSGTVESAVGVWADGAEPSTEITVPRASGSQLRYAASLLGKAGQQKAVLVWHPSASGPHVLYTFKVSGREPKEIASDVAHAGIENQTTTPGKGSSKLTIMDMDGSAAAKVDALAKVPGYTPVSAEHGTGEFIGSWTSREEGAQEYDKIIQGYEKANASQAYKGSLSFRSGDGQGTEGSDLRRRRSSAQVLAFDPNEPRDNKGKWTTGGFQPKATPVLTPNGKALWLGNNHYNLKKAGPDADVWEHDNGLTQIKVSKYNTTTQPNLRKYQVIDNTGKVIHNGHQFSKTQTFLQTTPAPKGSNPVVAPKSDVSPAFQQVADTLDKAGFAKGYPGATQETVFNHPLGLGVVYVDNKSGQWTHYSNGTKLGSGIGSKGLSESIGKAGYLLSPEGQAVSKSSTYDAHKSALTDAGYKSIAESNVGAVFMHPTAGSVSIEKATGNWTNTDANAKASENGTTTASLKESIANFKQMAGTPDTSTKPGATAAMHDLLTDSGYANGATADNGSTIYDHATKGVVIVKPDGTWAAYHPDTLAGIAQGSSTSELNSFLQGTKPAAAKSEPLNPYVAATVKMNDLKSLGFSLTDHGTAPNGEGTDLYTNPASNYTVHILPNGTGQSTFAIMDKTGATLKSGPYSTDMVSFLTHDSGAQVPKEAPTPVYDIPTDAAFRSKLNDVVAAQLPNFEGDKANFASPHTGLCGAVAKAMGIDPSIVAAAQAKIVQWTSSSTQSLRNDFNAATNGSDKADPGLVMEYAITQAKLTKLIPSGKVTLHRGLSTGNTDSAKADRAAQVAALKSIVAFPEWSVGYKTGGAESWSDSKNVAHGFGSVLIEQPVSTKDVFTSYKTNPESFFDHPHEQEWIVAPSSGILNFDNKHTHIVASGTLAVMQALTLLRNSGWKAKFVDTTHVILTPPPQDMDWLHRNRGVNAYSPDEARDKNGEWSKGVDPAVLKVFKDNPFVNVTKPIVGIDKAPNGHVGSFDPATGGTVFHGTGKRSIKFTPGETYTAVDYTETKPFARGEVPGAGGGPDPKVMELKAAPGKTLDVGDAVVELIMDSGDDDFHTMFDAARAQGARYVTFEHPGIESDREFPVLVSLYPNADLKSVGGWSLKDVAAKAHKLSAKTTFQGLPISIEQQKGEVRSGVASDGSKWSVKMPYPYGYIRGTKGVDGDAVDCFIGPVADAKFAYIVHQDTFDGTAYDEDKVMLGFKSADAAKAAYHSAYNNCDLFHSMTVMPMHEFIKKVMGTKTMVRPRKLHAQAKPVAPVRRPQMFVGTRAGHGTLASRTMPRCR